MDESYYTARLVITEGYEDRLDMTITCQNAQQLLRAKDTIADQMNTYIAEFAVQSGLTGAPRKPTNPTGKNTTSGTFTRTATAGSGTTSQDSSGRTASRGTIRTHSPTREATGWTPKESTKAQPFPLTSKETRYGQERIDRPV